jgi:hypothetical protein
MRSLRGAANDVKLRATTVPEINIACNYNRRCNKFNDLMLCNSDVEVPKHKIMFRKYPLYSLSYTTFLLRDKHEQEYNLCETFRSIMLNKKINIEIAERIAKGNKAYYANGKLIKSKFLKKHTKIKMYKTMIRPVVTYSLETLTLTAEDENNIRIFERLILRKIFGLINTDNIWRIRSNMEIDKLIKGADIVRFINAQRIKWLVHIQRMDQARSTRKLLDWKPMELDQQEDQDSDGKRMSWKM